MTKTRDCVPCLLGSVLVGAAASVWAFISGATIWIATSCCLFGTGAVAAQRVHSLSLAHSIDESAETLKKENGRLKSHLEAMQLNVGELEGQVHDLRGISKLLDGTESDLREVEIKLRATFSGIERENKKHRNNNLVALFMLVDQDKNGELSTDEVQTLSDYVWISYGIRLDFQSMDRDGDRKLSLPEFLTIFDDQAENC